MFAGIGVGVGESPCALLLPGTAQKLSAASIHSHMLVHFCMSMVLPHVDMVQTNVNGILSMGHGHPERRSRSPERMRRARIVAHALRCCACRLAAAQKLFRQALRAAAQHDKCLELMLLLFLNKLT